jgi:3-oxoacyl-[acyl-carrier-protein] synthase II
VVVTGVEMITPLGGTADATFTAMLAGRSGIRPIAHFDASGLGCRIAGSIEEDIAADAKLADDVAYRVREAPRGARFGVVAGLGAWRDAGLEAGPTLAHRVGVCVGTSGRMYDMDYLQRVQRFLGDTGTWEPHRFRADPDPDALLVGELHADRRDAAAALLGTLVGAAGPNLAVSATCASGTQALGEAYWAIREDDADVMIAGGCDAFLNFTGVASFDLLSALSTRYNNEPARASRPFDRRRDGFVLAEGGGAAVLEELGHALRRGVEPLAEVIGYGSSCDAYRITDSPPDGRGAALAMTAALDDARLPASAVGYISAHGTSTLLNDRAETRAIRQVFGAAAGATPISSQKSMLGHAIGGAGAIEFVTCVQALRHRILPPTINYEYPDPECDLDYIPNVARDLAVDVTMSNSLGFGGQNACILLRRWPQRAGGRS